MVFAGLLLVAVYLLQVLGRLLLAPIILVVTTIQFVVTAALAIVRWVFTEKGVSLDYGFIRIGH